MIATAAGLGRVGRVDLLVRADGGGPAPLPEGATAADPPARST
ncbi:MAG: hypothetical protein U0871_09555 [Gemmataceae bacterium]